MMLIAACHLVMATLSGQTATTPPPPTVGAPLVFSVADVPLPAAPRLLEAFDTDEDGTLELVVLGSSVGPLEGQVSVLVNDGHGAFSPGWARPHPAASKALGAMWLDAADVDLDGDLDVTITPGAEDHSIRLNDGQGRLDAFLTSTWFGGFAGPGAFGDIDGDGLPDLAHYTDDFGPFLDYSSGEGDGTFTGVGAWLGNPQDGRTLILFADLDENGGTEPVISTHAGLHAALDDVHWTPLATGAFRGHAAVDLDGDRHLDLVFAEPDEDRIGVLLGNGDGTFAAVSWYATGRAPDQILVVDVDGDGELDVVTGNMDQGSISILPGDGTGSFGAKQDVATGPDPLGLASGDFDLDGDTDLAVADSGSLTVTVLLQQ